MRTICTFSFKDFFKANFNKDILSGTPFSEMGRPSTLPSNSSSSLSSSLSSIKNLTKSGLGNRFTNLKKSYLSPGPAT